MPAKDKSSIVSTHPCDSPLLERNHATTDLLGGDFGLIDWDKRRSDTDAKTSDDTPDDEHADILRSSLNTKLSLISFPKIIQRYYLH